MLAVAWLAGCAPSGPGDLEPIPEDTLPCEAPDLWPETLRSSAFPIAVHHRPGEQGMAAVVLAHLETSWQVEVVDLGFSPPLPDGGRCGDDDDFDVFVWAGLEVAYVDAIAENDATPHDDWFTYMAIDPWGPYGAPILDGTVAHELNHACQASDDWWDAPIVFEMTSTFLEDVVFDDDDDYATLLGEFQSRPDWSLDRDDDYETWFMYGSALYLHFVRDRYFGGDPSFVADMWRGARSPAGHNEPDFEDALDGLLGAAAGHTFLDSVVEFAKWRWYVADHDDGAHFEEGGTWPAEAKVPVVGSIHAALPRDQSVDVMALGSAYVAVEGGPVRVSLANADPGVTWVVQVVPGAASDGDVLDLSAPVVLDASVPRAVVLTALPLPEHADPDDRTDARFHATLRFEAP